MSRGPHGRFAPQDALARFLAKCKFDPGTGCVLWTGGKTAGRGHNVPYGAFWFEGRRWFAHRWAAKFIHGLDIEGMQVDHCCSDHVPELTAPNTLCVQHVQAITADLNRELQTRRLWARLECGLENYEDYFSVGSSDPWSSIPFYPEPEWLKLGVLTDG